MIGQHKHYKMRFRTVINLSGCYTKHELSKGCTINLTSVSSKLATLNTNKNPFEWSIPSNSEVNSPPSIYGHTANLYNDYMIITFGYNIDAQLYNSQVYLYNIKSKKWVTTFSPSDNKTTMTATSSTTSSTTLSISKPIITYPPTKKSSKSLTIGLGIGIGVVFLVSCIFIISFIVRRTRQTENSQNLVIIETPGNNELS
ncbi:hypothetical protein Glove_476g64 [Diversispora epigaea]|uniref:Uncharacterized protein n=1 Tax=Diversispora epigaea TaxID=1348612 RepID=A0A397GKS3_9GLOM|nr:hypothetical protein Glove_476g64 [Diversispora epigaea]